MRPAKAQTSLRINQISNTESWRIHDRNHMSRLIIYVPANGGLDLIASTSSESSDESVHIHLHKCDDDKNERKTINSYALISDN